MSVVQTGDKSHTTGGLFADTSICGPRARLVSGADSSIYGSCETDALYMAMSAASYGSFATGDYEHVVHQTCAPREQFCIRPICQMPYA